MIMRAIFIPDACSICMESVFEGFPAAVIIYSCFRTTAAPKWNALRTYIPVWFAILILTILCVYNTVREEKTWKIFLPLRFAYTYALYIPRDLCNIRSLIKTQQTRLVMLFFLMCIYNIS